MLSDLLGCFIAVICSESGVFVWRSLELTNTFCWLTVLRLQYVMNIHELINAVTARDEVCDHSLSLSLSLSPGEY